MAAGGTAEPFATSVRTDDCDDVSDAPKIYVLSDTSLSLLVSWSRNEVQFRHIVSHKER